MYVRGLMDMLYMFAVPTNMCTSCSRSALLLFFYFFTIISHFSAKSDIVSESLQPDAWKKIQLKEAEMNKVPEMFIDTRPQQAPVFTTHLENQHQLQEAQHVHLEAQVEPRADPNLKVTLYSQSGRHVTSIIQVISNFTNSDTYLNLKREN